MFNVFPSNYRIAKKIVRHLSNISFLRTCKYVKVIPKGLQAVNILRNTTNSPLAATLARKHSRQWLQLALDTQYHRLSRIRSDVFPLNYHEDQQLTKFQESLREKKQRKIQYLMNQQPKEPQPAEQQQGFNNLSTEILDPDLVTILNKGPSYVNADPKCLPKLCLTSKASLQSATDRLQEEKVSESAINEFKGGIARIIEVCEQSGTEMLKSKRLRYRLPSNQIKITPTDKSKRLVALDSNH